MACGEAVEVWVKYLTVCWQSVSYPCGIKFCEFSFQYPCGVKWCKKWGVKYPCGVKYCTGTIPYPCGFKWCEIRIPYFCIKRRLTKKFCYDFQSVGGTCYLFYDDLYGCCDGQEYNWGSPCLFGTYGDSGPRPGSVGSSSKYDRKCFDKPLKPIGPCRPGKSLPGIGDLPSSPVDPGSVAPHVSKSGPNIYRVIMLINQKLGKCKKCMNLSILLFLISWATFLMFIHFDLLKSISFLLGGTLVIVFSILFIGHTSRYLFLKSKESKITQPCGCRK